MTRGVVDTCNKGDSVTDENYLPQVNYSLLVTQEIAFHTEKKNIFPSEQITNLLSFLDADYEKYLGHIIKNFIILCEPSKCSNVPINVDILKSILTKGKSEVQHI